MLEGFLRDLEVTRSDLETWQSEQVEYFSTLGKEPDEDLYKVAYVELLQELEAARYIFTSITLYIIYNGPQICRRDPNIQLPEYRSRFLGNSRPDV